MKCDKFRRVFMLNSVDAFLLLLLDVMNRTPLKLALHFAWLPILLIVFSIDSILNVVSNV